MSTALMSTPMGSSGVQFKHWSIPRKYGTTLYPIQELTIPSSFLALGEGHALTFAMTRNSQCANDLGRPRLDEEDQGTTRENHAAP